MAIELEQISVGHEALKVGPAAAPVAMGFLGYPLNEWLVLATLIYTICLLITLWRDRWGGRQLLRKVWQWAKQRL